MVNRIAKRLAKIEQSQTQQSNESNKMLVELCGRRDALFYPWRGVAANHGLIHFEMQGEYHAGKRGFSAKASGVVDWQSASEQRSLLIDRGLATAMRSAGGEINALKLTPLGDATARELAGLYRLNDPLPRIIYAYMAAMFDVCQPWINGRWMSESMLWQRPLYGNPDSWGRLTEAMLPLLTAGLVKASYDIPGRVYYSLRHWDADGKLLIQKIEEPIVDVAYEAGMDDAYAAAYNAERHSLEKLEPSHEIHIPLPASCFHTFMDEESMQPRESDTDERRASCERFQRLLEARNADYRLQEFIADLEARLAAVSEKVELE